MDTIINSVRDMYDSGWSIIPLKHTTEVTILRAESREEGLSVMQTAESDPDVYMVCVIDHSRRVVATCINGMIDSVGAF